MMPDLSQMEEIVCPKCRKPLTVTVLANWRARFNGCSCPDREIHEVPDCVMAGFGNLLFLYKPRSISAPI